MGSRTGGLLCHLKPRSESGTLCPFSNKWNSWAFKLSECSAHRFHITQRVVEGVNHVTGIHLVLIGAPGEIDSDRLRAIFTLRLRGFAAPSPIAIAIGRTGVLILTRDTAKPKWAPVGDRFSFSGTPGRTRTADHLVRRQVLMKCYDTG